MKRRLFSITLMALLVLLLVVGGAAGQGPEGEGDVQPQGEVSITAILNSRISYQGILKEDGTPVSESRDMIFRLYSDSSCTTLVDTINKPGVQPTDGLFSVELDVDQGDFDGQGLWMQVEVGGTTVINCQEILPTPYALSLRPGAEIADTGSNVQLNRYFSLPPWTYKYGIQSVVTGSYDFNYGVYGYASGGNSSNYGVYGYASATNGYGGFFVNDGGGNLLAANNLATTSDLEFRVDSTGAAYADGGWQGAADFAELMSTEGDPAAYEPGDVLVVSAEFDRAVALSSEPYSPMVLGVYSGKPGFVGSSHVMEGQRDDEIAVAIVGIVPCKVSAENGPIRRGDLLVTSSTPGHAMRAGPNPPAGTVVGKALGSLDSGTGFIEMLVMLQ